MVEKFQRNIDFTPLKTTPDRILALHGDMFTEPRPLLKDPSKRNKNKYCHFHKDHGHLTAECIELRRQIENHIQNGELKEFVMAMVANPDPAPRRQVPQNDRRQERGKEVVAGGSNNKLKIWGVNGVGRTPSIKRNDKLKRKKNPIT